MKLYHGSTVIVQNPVILDKQRLLDFGKGFYTTTNQIQAERWATLKKIRYGDKNIQAFVTIYELNNSIFSDKSYNIKEYKRADEEWLDFVYSNRYDISQHNYDIVIAPVANDTLYATLSLYEAGLLNKDETIIRLKSHLLFDQVSFHNDKTLTELKYIGTLNIH